MLFRAFRSSPQIQQEYSNRKWEIQISILHDPVISSTDGRMAVVGLSVGYLLTVCRVGSITYPKRLRSQIQATVVTSCWHSRIKQKGPTFGNRRAKSSSLFLSPGCWLALLLIALSLAKRHSQIPWRSDQSRTFNLRQTADP